MRIKRYCGHEEVIKDPETIDKFLMERGRKCEKCRTIGTPKSRKAIGEEQLPRPMAVTMDIYRE
ncbi:MAG: hypothetical protein M1537_01755 [Nitrospirae bacterium]|nr:hypothetical protein [Nitrospirota bacterium]MCL5284194.1 hypothetical protein [Nitrospirota bacterium]